MFKFYHMSCMYFPFLDIITDTEAMSLTFQQNLSQRYPEKFRVQDTRQGLLTAYDTVLKANLVWPSNINKTTKKDGTISFPTVVKTQELNSSKSDNDKKQSLEHGDLDTRRRVRRAVTDDGSTSESTGEESGSVAMGNGMHSDSVEEKVASVFHGLSLFIVVVLLIEVTIIMFE